MMHFSSTFVLWYLPIRVWLQDHKAQLHPLRRYVPPYANLVQLWLPCSDWATPDIDMIAHDFVGKWVKIDQCVMSDSEIKMLLTLACYYEYGKYQPIKREMGDY